VIACPGHSGSTLLAMCLNAHSDITVFGEFCTLPKRVAGINKGMGKGLCSYHKENCKFLDDREVARIRAAYGSDGSRFGHLRKLFQHSSYVRHFQKISGASLIGDSSKDVRWARTLWSVWRWAFDIKFIALIRDGRGVVASHYRQGREIESHAQQWAEEAMKLSKLIETIPSDRIISVRYEDLAIDPETELQKICRFFGLDFETQMLCYEKVDHHIVGGNSGARIAVRIANGQEVDPVSPNVRFYLKKKSRFFLDERWKDELSSEQITSIERIAGDALKKFQYLT